MESPETLADILLSGFLEWDSLRCLPVGVEYAGESRTSASDRSGEEVAPADPNASLLDVYDEYFEKVDINDGGTKIQDKTFAIDNYLKRTVVTDLAQLEDWDDPLQPVSSEHVALPLLSFQRNVSETRLARILVPRNPGKNNTYGPKTDLFNKEDSLAVLKKNLTLDVVIRRTGAVSIRCYDSSRQ